MSSPKTLFGQLMLILAASLLLAQSVTFLLVFSERSLSTRDVMLRYLAADVASSVAILDRLPASERPDWLDRLGRPNYQLHLDEPAAPGPGKGGSSDLALALAGSLSRALSQHVDIVPVSPAASRFQLAVRLQDGKPLVVEVTPAGRGPASWLLAALVGQWVLLAMGCWWAVRRATSPLVQLAEAARNLTPGRRGITTWALGGTREVADAAAAFEDMQQRIEAHLEERSEMLGAISHDLQTPITRMRLRTELVADEALCHKLQADLDQMQHLVEMGLAYARTREAVHEPEALTDLSALLESVVSDFQDAGRSVTWLGGPALSVRTRPRALQRVLVNLIDNAVKFAGHADVALSLRTNTVVIDVLDRGPGIPVEEIDKVMRPFYRIENSRSRQTGGTGLGLAIVQRLLMHCQGELTLTGREGGGLQATVRIVMPPSPDRSRT